MPVRIYDLAKKLGIESKDVLVEAKKLGIAQAKVPSSSLDKITAEYLEQELEKLFPHHAAPASVPVAVQPVAVIPAIPEPPPVAPVVSEAPVETPTVAVSAAPAAPEVRTCYPRLLPAGTRSGYRASAATTASDRCPGTTSGSASGSRRNSQDRIASSRADATTAATAAQSWRQGWFCPIACQTVRSPAVRSAWGPCSSAVRSGVRQAGLSQPWRQPQRPWRPRGAVQPAVRRPKIRAKNSSKAGYSRRGRGQARRKICPARHRPGHHA